MKHLAHDLGQALRALNSVAFDLGYKHGIAGSCAATLNDACDTSHEDVLAMFDLAIESANRTEADS